MPPRYLRKGSTKLKSCSEFKVEACDTAPADQCCGALPCTLCLELEVYGEATTYGTATFGGSSWTGTVGGLAFVSYWERDAYGECEYIVTLDGEEVYRATCYEGASCRDPGGSVGVTIGYDEGTLTWLKHEPRPLAVTTDPDTGCNDFFCGSCRCSCDCLCVTIMDGYDATITRGEICDVSYACDSPVWAGTVGDYALSIALGRDSYGNCIISLTANDEEADPVVVTGCADMSASVTLYDGTVIAVACKDCSSCDTIYTCCDGASLPATIHLTLLSQNTECGCLDGVIVPLNATGVVDSRVTYTGILQGPCVINGDPSQAHWYKFTATCGAPESFLSVVVETLDILTADPDPALGDSRWVVSTSYLKTSGQCDPFYFYYALSGPGNSQNDIWLGCANTSMDLPWVELEITR